MFTVTKSRLGAAIVRDAALRFQWHELFINSKSR